MPFARAPYLSLPSSQLLLSLGFCFSVTEELGNRTLLKLQADQLRSRQSFYTEVQNSHSPCLEVSQLSARS